MVARGRLITPTYHARRVAAGTTKETTVTRDEREQLIWHDAYMLAMSQDPHPTEASGWADAAVAEFRKRYPPQPVAPPAVWCDEPPFAKDGCAYYCWVEGSTVPQSIYWSGGSGAWIYFCGNTPMQPLNGRRVCPITKPPESAP